VSTGLSPWQSGSLLRGACLWDGLNRLSER